MNLFPLHGDNKKHLTNRHGAAPDSESFLRASDPPPEAFKARTRTASRKMCLNSKSATASAAKNYSALLRWRWLRSQAAAVNDAKT